VTEGLVELAAAKIGIDPLDMRPRNLIPTTGYPCAGPSGIKFGSFRTTPHLEKARQDDGLRQAPREQRNCAKKKIYRGLGFASFIEVTKSVRRFYGVGGAKISAQDGATLRPTRRVR